MCGIAGKVAGPGGRVDPSWVGRALKLIEHRGPDDAAFFAAPRAADTARSLESYLGNDLARHPADAEIALAHRRLAILDLSAAGRQPMASDDGRYVLVFNGEIYNYVELRDELKALGCRFHSDSDTEVLLHALIRWGADALPRFVGMFAFAFLDRNARTMLLARDFFGIKPLYYRAGADGFAFASELPPLLDDDGDRQANPARLYEYLCYGLTDHGGETLFSGIRQIPPAHLARVDLDRPDQPVLERYWRIPLDRPIDISFDEAATKLRELFLDSVRLHLRSDVPVGAALSGGIDSSAIVMAMRHLMGDRIELHLFSYIADDPALSEERWIDLIGRTVKAEVHKVYAAPSDLMTDLPRVAASQGEPFGSSSICMQHRVFELARKHGIKVMLDGQGADEMLGGYRPYAAARLATLIKRGRLVEAARFWRRASKLPGAGGLWMCQRAGFFLMPAPLRSVIRQWLRSDVAPAWLNVEWFRERGVEPGVLDYADGRDVLRDQLRRSIEELSLPHLLRYEDRNSMAFSIESRVPFLTPQIATFVLSLPEEYLIAPDGTSKAVFRAAMRGIVPDEILDRRDKIGFATPQAQWLTQLRPWVEQALSETTGAALPVLHSGDASRQWEQMLAGRRRFDSTAWRWLNLIDWTRRFAVDFR